MNNYFNLLKCLKNTFTVFAFCILFNNVGYSQTKSRFIGNPIKVGNFIIAEFDFSEKLNWKDANSACMGLGSGWRLPSKNELDLIYRSKNRLNSEFKSEFYWSATPTSKDFVPDYWVQDFRTGDQINYKYSSWIQEWNVRAIKSVK